MFLISMEGISNKLLLKMWTVCSFYLSFVLRPTSHQNLATNVRLFPFANFIYKFANLQILFITFAH